MAKVISKLLFWPESVKMSWSEKTPSVLTLLPAISILKLFLVATRPFREDVSPDKKRAIRRISLMQLFKAAVFGSILFISYSALKSFIFDNIKITNIQLLYIFVGLLIMPLTDWVLWNADLDASLRRELKVREVELGLSEVELSLSQAPEESMLIVQPPSESEILEGLAKIKRDAAAAGLEPGEYVKQKRENRAGMRPPSDPNDIHQYAALKDYLES